VCMLPDDNRGRPGTSSRLPKPSSACGRGGGRLGGGVDSRTERPRSVASEAEQGPATGVHSFAHYSQLSAGRVRTRLPSVPWTRKARPLACGHRQAPPVRPQKPSAAFPNVPSQNKGQRRPHPDPPLASNQLPTS
jgi:hypothetical protein